MTQANFDLSKNWIILADASGRNAACELALYISGMRKNAGAQALSPPIYEGQEAFENSMPAIRLKDAGEGSCANGFSWNFNADADKIEITGHSERGLWNGIFDFLAALGFKWDAPGQQEWPQFLASSASDSIVYPLNKDKADQPLYSSAQNRRRVFVNKNTGKTEKKDLVLWAARNKYDALVFSLAEKSFWRDGGDLYGAKKFAFIIEAGGCDLPLLLPRSMFLLNPGMFRMEEGRRTSRHHFCATNPKTIAAIMKRARQLFLNALAALSQPKVLHLLPDAGSEYQWCACPACRAFSPNEQYIIAVKTAAQELLNLDPLALLSFVDLASAREAAEKGAIPKKENMFPLKRSQTQKLD